ncbi:amidohydrolase/deacetylase family metallohydrolase [Pantoea agglomerans]|uniref:amidohydrolase/deacetylase family metallohydrolase n=1 Tax=Enterobacter agglomerans TaxID=549 RepID=UPI0013BF7551|nr:amidohydrolase/deacetylase family metallohydrolase [Pantoea agglomerans]MBD8159733.1 amidohydrolase/deacetylase family metallohydrolase [Pantoea agglomerans]MBD8231994.1 amidohydrolase/deacetylase family metallohydrolase [Pantoea agglomerans]MDY0998996.1 amidohydrolase/deacetylase family metallohydrolase [Pantoea agglomerans]NEG50715.1 amidohydrolase/deacetylase family metallohydrolase [Pantoea agglomerans]UJQ24525.1 amidohydrolase/deacetylase family metallohydrolase [Pantoea agglomerans]
MYDLIIRGARLSDEQVVDIALQDGRIAAIGKVQGNAQHERDLAGRYYLSAGWIDSHVHCYPKSPIYHDEADAIGVAHGVTTVVDAGSTGAEHIDDFYRLTRAAQTQVYALINIARTGIVTQNELADMTQIDGEAVQQAVARLPDFIVGLKARISSSVVGENGVQPLIKAKAIQQETGGLPLMVHIGNNPPNLDQIADLLTTGDIITHCFNGKPNRILTPQGELKAAVKQAIARGVKLDVGHGSASFSFEVARAAIAQGILPDTISSDIYCRNRLAGPVHNLAHVMSKFFSVGMTLPQVIDCVTVNAAAGLRLQRKGQLKVGYDADLTVFSVKEETRPFIDSEGEQVAGEKHLVPLAAVVAGTWIATEEGIAHDLGV